MDSENRERGKKRRDVLYGVLVAAGILVAVGMILWRLMPGASDGGGSPPEKASDERGSASKEAPTKVAPGYSRFEHDSGALWVEVPSEWDERVIVDEEGEKGRASWSGFLGEGESAGPSMTAVNDLYSWRNGTPGHQGVYAVASKNLAQYTEDELVALGPNDYSSSCERGTTRDFERPPYSGKVLEWRNCGGDSGHSATTLAAAPEGRECVILAQVGGYFRTQTDEERRLHTLNTLEADCSRIG